MIMHAYDLADVHVCNASPKEFPRDFFWCFLKHIRKFVIKRPIHQIIFILGVIIEAVTVETAFLGDLLYGDLTQRLAFHAFFDCGCKQ